MARRRQDLLEIRPVPVTIEGMKTRTLGTDGLTTSAIGYGAMALVDGMYGHSDDEHGLATLRHAIELGTRRLEENGYAEVRFYPARLLEGRLSRPTTAG